MHTMSRIAEEKSEIRLAYLYFKAHTDITNCTPFLIVFFLLPSTSSQGTSNHTKQSFESRENVAYIGSFWLQDQWLLPIFGKILYPLCSMGWPSSRQHYPGNNHPITLPWSKGRADREDTILPLEHESPTFGAGCIIIQNSLLRLFVRAVIDHMMIWNSTPTRL